MTEREFKELTGKPLKSYAYQCHAAAITLVRALGPGHRVARGVCHGVGGQHSWVVVGDDCYDRDAKILDPTLWSYNPRITGVYEGTNCVRHFPHGVGSIWDWGRPDYAIDEPIRLDGNFSPQARAFLDMLGALDRRGWMSLASDAPVGGWPAGEILAAMDDHPDLKALVPVDRLGMLTDRNPGGLYLP